MIQGFDKISARKSSLTTKFKQKKNLIKNKTDQ